MANTTKLSNGVMLTVFLVILLVLWIFGDLFTFVVGFLIESLVFANAYDRANTAAH